MDLKREREENSEANDSPYKQNLASQALQIFHWSMTPSTFQKCVSAVSLVGNRGIIGFILAERGKWPIEIKELIYNSKGISDIDT